MRFTSTAAALLASESAKAISMKSQSHQAYMPAHTPVTQSLLKAASRAERANYLKQHRQASLSQMAANTVHSKSLVQQDVGGVTPPEADVVYAEYAPVVGDNFIMGSSPTYMIAHPGEEIPANWYLPTQAFVDNYMDLMRQEAGLIGDWAIIAYFGGQIKGTGYGGGDILVESVPDGESGMYYVNEVDPPVTDILLVQADPNNSFIPQDCHLGNGNMCEENVNDMCQHWGYDCTCVPDPYVLPPTRKPVFPDCPDYIDFEQDVPGFNALQAQLGWDGGWTPIPTGYWGYWIYLDQPTLFGRASWEEWKFGITFRSDESDAYMTQWCPVAGVVEFTFEGDWVYRYIYNIPDNDEVAGDIDVGDCFTPVYYDGTINGGAFVPTMEQQYDSPGFCVGEPYLDDVSFLMPMTRILFIFADTDGDDCVNKDEFFYIVGQSAGGMEDFMQIAGDNFDACDQANEASGVLTWAELNNCIAEADDQYSEMAQALFIYFEESGDYALSREEMLAGIASMGDYLDELDSEFRFYWDYFDFPDSDAGDYTGTGEGLEGYYTGSGNDGCVLLEEFEAGLETMVQVDETDIINYWIDYYYSTYQITEYYWWIFHTRNGGFDWDGYRTRVHDGPAFDGKPFLYQCGDGAPVPAFMWWMDDMCYFSLDEFRDEEFDNYDAARQGTCNIPGHKSIGEDYDWSIIEVDLMSYGEPEHTAHGIYDPVGLSWGPTGEHTDLKFYTAADGVHQACWLWERTEEYCAACDQAGGYPGADFFGAGLESTYYEDYYQETATDSYSFGEFDATNQYGTVEEVTEEFTIPAPEYGLYEEEYFNEPEPVPEPAPEPSFGLYEEEYFNEPEPSFGLYEEEYFDY